MTTTTIRGIVLGAGLPKICVPLTGADVAALRAEAASLRPGDADLVELRIDHLADVDDAGAVDDALGAVRALLPDTPLLFTFRTREEGGEHSLDPSGYEELLTAAIASGRIDAVDVEMRTERERRERIVDAAHRAGVAVVMSSHDFVTTPDRDEIVGRLMTQQDLGADVVKIAVMPADAADVLTLLEATVAYSSTVGARPAITMAMGALGLVTRLAGETFGSCLTFGSVGRPSAPGQIDARALRDVLELMHGAV